MVSVTSGGSVAAWSLAATPDTVTDLSGPSAPSSFAVTVTAPVLAVSPAAMVSTAFGLRAKSPAAALAPADADTVIVVSAPDGCESVAVTRETPPFSGIDAGFRTRAAVGVASSSAMVSITGGGAATPETEPETVTDLSGRSAASFTAAIVTVPVLVVSPSAMVSTLPDCVKLPEAAFAPAVAVTVIATSASKALSSVAVTVAEPPDSGIDACDRFSVAAGRSLTVAAPVVSAMVPAWAAAATVTAKVRSPARAPPL